MDGSPPWAFPLDNVPLVQNTSRPPITQANAIENYAPIRVRKQKKKRFGPGGIAFMVGTATLLATGFALLIAIRLNKLYRKKLENYESDHSSLPSYPISATKGILYRAYRWFIRLVKAKNHITESPNNVNMISK